MCQTRYIRHIRQAAIVDNGMMLRVRTVETRITPGACTGGLMDVGSSIGRCGETGSPARMSAGTSGSIAILAACSLQRRRRGCAACKEPECRRHWTHDGYRARPFATGIGLLCPFLSMASVGRMFPERRETRSMTVGRPVGHRNKLGQRQSRGRCWKHLLAGPATWQHEPASTATDTRRPKRSRLPLLILSYYVSITGCVRQRHTRKQLVATSEMVAEIQSMPSLS